VKYPLITRIDELFDSDVKYQKLATPHESEHIYTFAHKDNKFLVHIQHDRSMASVDFVDKHSSMELSGAHPHDAVKVMSGVHKIVKDHIAAHPEVKTVHFSAAGGDHGRVGLYRRMAKRVGETREKVYDTDPGKKSHVFTVKVR
jgi:hypothetical protein